MPIINIEPASRAGMRFLISLYGLSETGKTFSAIRLAAGMETDPTKRMLLDTEGGQRGRAYVDAVPGGYMYASLSPPFTPERYIEALDDIEAAGINVLVIDSISHAWFAEGGILDMVENASEKNDMAKWAKPKRRLGKMTRRLLSSDMHIILCSRAKQPLIEQIVDGRKKLTPGPVVPVQEKTLRYDMTVMAHMLGDGLFDVSAPAGKCPGPLRDVFASGEKMTEDMGKRLVAWLGGADIRSPEVRDLVNRADKAANGGMSSYTEFWGGLTKDQRKTLLPGHENRKSVAAAADAERLRQESEGADNHAETDTPASSPADDAFAEAVEAAQQGVGALNEWWNGGKGAQTALGTDRSKKSLIAHRWRELEDIASAAEVDTPEEPA